MPDVAILVVEGCYASCAAGFADVLQVANVHLRHQQGAAAGSRAFACAFVSPDGGPVATSNGVRIETQPYGRRRFDVITIPAIPLSGLQAVRPVPRSAAENL